MPGAARPATGDGCLPPPFVCTVSSARARATWCPAVKQVLMAGKYRIELILFSLLGLGASVAALYVHYQLMVDPGYSSFCDISATVSCEQVVESAYGRVFGIPVAAGGAIW